MELGHIAVGINDHIYGFYPAKDFASPKTEVPGDVRKQTKHQVAEGYLEIYLGPAFREEVIILDKGRIAPKDPDKRMPFVYIFTIELPNGSKQILFHLFEKYHSNPPNYHRKENNCVTLTIDAFLPFLSLKQTFWPDRLREQLAEKVMHQAQQEKGRVVSQNRKEINYNFIWTQGV